MPPGFEFPSPDTQLWVPVVVNPSNVGYVWGGSNLWPIGRLRKGMPLAAAQEELKPAVDRIRRMFPWRMPDAWGRGARVVLHSEAVVKEVRPKLFALSMASLLLLLIACGNVANLQLARSVKREREFTMREALGAGRSRILRQLLTENFVLIFAGGLAGLVSAAVILVSIPSLLPRETPRLHEIAPDRMLLVSAILGMLLTILLFSIGPAFRSLQSRRESLVGRGGGLSKRASGFSLVLIGVQLALATALLIGAGLMGRTLMHLSDVDSGIHGSGVITARISAGPSRCGDAESCWSLLENLGKTMIEVPGVRSVNWSNTIPLDKEISAMAVEVQNHPKSPGEPAFVFWNAAATPGYFHALGIPLRAGRNFTTADRKGTSPVMIISESTARRFWPGESAVGKRIRPMSGTDWLTVVGVVGEVAHYSLAGFPNWIDGVQYVPLAQGLPRVAESFQSTVFLESSRIQSAAALAAAVRRNFPDVVVSHVASLAEIRSDSVADQRSTALLLALFAGLGLLLGVAGVYGVISHRAAQRTREIGIRIALGASAKKVVGMVLGETLVVSLAGTGGGVVAAFALSRFLRSLLFGVTGHDTATLLICPALLLTAALLAAAVPGVRASRTDPAAILREE